MHNQKFKSTFWSDVAFTNFVNENPELKAKSETEYIPETRNRVIDKRIGLEKLKELLQKNSLLHIIT